MPLILSGSAGLSGNVGTTTKEMLPAGSVLQVVQAVKTDTQVINSTSWVDVASLSASITPLSATSKILVLCNVALGAVNEAGLRVLRNDALFLGSVEGAPSGNFATSIDDGQSYATSSAVAQLLDSPNSVLPVVYKIQCITPYLTGRLAYINRYPAGWPTTYSTGTVSTLTLMEIKA